MAEAGYMVLLAGECMHLNSRTQGVKEVFFRFHDEKHWIAHADDGFAELKYDFNKHLRWNGDQGWVVYGVIETLRRAKPDESGNFVEVA